LEAAWYLFELEKSARLVFALCMADQMPGKLEDCWHQAVQLMVAQLAGSLKEELLRWKVAGRPVADSVDLLGEQHCSSVEALTLEALDHPAAAHAEAKTSKNQ
jgi:hypothetical protein